MLFKFEEFRAHTTTNLKNVSCRAEDLLQGNLGKQAIDPLYTRY